MANLVLDPVNNVSRASLSLQKEGFPSKALSLVHRGQSRKAAAPWSLLEAVNKRERTMERNRVGKEREKNLCIHSVASAGVDIQLVFVHSKK